jgi:ABC-type iron transport system FetAB ATPase subunit
MTVFQLRDFAYHTIQPFDLKIRAGETISLFGPSGSGKTLLLRALCDLDSHQGTLVLNDTHYHDCEPHLWRRQVGFLPSESSWWFPTVGEHFPGCNRERLQQLGFSENTLTWDIHRLSAGEKQRLGLLRLLANSPRVLLLDEPTANLDQDNRLLVERLLSDWIRETGGIIIWVTHDRAQRCRVAKRHFDIVDNQIQEVSL